jgi:hypothetical protein
MSVDPVDPVEARIGRIFRPCGKCPHDKNHRAARKSWAYGSRRIHNKTPVRTRICHGCGERAPLHTRVDPRICEPCRTKPVEYPF